MPFEQWWEDETDDSMRRKLRKNRERTWEMLEQFIASVPAGSGIGAWAAKNGVTPEEAERIAVLAERFARFGERIGDLA